MAKTKEQDRASKSVRTKADTTPKSPYTTKPGSLRRFLKEIPKKPKPQKFDVNLLRSWGFTDANDYSILRVLKAIRVLNDKNEPTEVYSRFMAIDDGAKAIAPEIRRVYAPLFQASHTPYTESNEKLNNLFNIHSGGGERALDQQIQTFKALCENASFDQDATPVSGGDASVASSAGGASLPRTDRSSALAAVNINLHIHLPENKSRRDYEDIIEDIARYIFGRETSQRRE